jgi:hypothetical protein
MIRWTTVPLTKASRLNREEFQILHFVGGGMLNDISAVVATIRGDDKEQKS